jgi:hypothetical protein
MRRHRAEPSSPTLPARFHACCHCRRSAPRWIAVSGQSPPRPVLSASVPTHARALAPFPQHTTPGPPLGHVACFHDCCHRAGSACSLRAIRCRCGISPVHSNIRKPTTPRQATCRPTVCHTPPSSFPRHLCSVPLCISAHTRILPIASCQIHHNDQSPPPDRMPSSACPCSPSLPHVCSPRHANPSRHPAISPPRLFSSRSTPPLLAFPYQLHHIALTPHATTRSTVTHTCAVCHLATARSCLLKHAAAICLPCCTSSRQAHRAGRVVTSLH